MSAVRLSRVGLVGTGLLSLFLLMALAPWALSPHGTGDQIGASLLPPAPGHLLGTDNLGRDSLTLLIWGSRVSLLVGLGAGLGGIGGGLLLGIAAGNLGGLADRLLMRLCDVLQALPRLPLFILVAVYAGPSLENVALAISALSVPNVARVIRGQVISLKQNRYVHASQMFGAGSGYLARRHFLPELFPVVVASTIQIVGFAVLAESGLAFLGLGDPTTRSWGMMLHYALESPSTYLTSAWLWRVLPPTLCIVLLIVSIALIGRALEEPLDPLLRSARRSSGRG